MKLPRYWNEQDRMIWIRPASIEFSGDYPGIRLSDQGWSFDIANAAKWNDLVTLVLPGYRGVGHLRLHVAEHIHAKLDLIHIPAPTQGAFVLSIDLADGAALSLTEIFSGSSDSLQKIDRFASLGTGSTLSLHTGIVGSREIDLQDEWDLVGEQSEMRAELLAVAGSDDRWNAYQTIRHLAPFSTSSVTNLLLSAGTSRMNLEVSGIIEKGNSHSSCHQTNRGVILEESGVISVEPKLIIDEYDVDAGHGCAIGQINADELYYLQTRGLSESAAKRLIVAGYLSPLFQRIANPGFARQLNRKIAQKMKGADL